MLPGIKSRLIASHLAVAIVAAAAVSVVLSVAFTRLQTEYYKHALLASALALADALETDFGTPHGQVQARHALRKLAANRPWGLAVIDEAGTVSSSTDVSLPEGRRLATPGEVAAARRSVSLIPNATDQEPYAIAVAPVEQNRRTIGLVRAWVTRREFDHSVAPIKRTLFGALAAVCVLSVLLSVVLAQALITPIRRMRQLSQRVARGDFAIRIGRTTDDELGALASDLDAMASRLEDLENLRRDFVGVRTANRAGLRRHLGLRLCVAHAADAVYRSVFFRDDRNARVSALAAAPTGHRDGGWLVSGQRRADHAVFRPGHE
ncbi:MAG: HAMP domain-containing protein, partial [Armatimonadota bacterium]